MARRPVFTDYSPEMQARIRKAQEALENKADRITTQKLNRFSDARETRVVLKEAVLPPAVIVIVKPKIPKKPRIKPRAGRKVPPERRTKYFNRILGGVTGHTKYFNKITTVDGRKFHSKKEANRFVVLRELEKAGVIKNLECQVRMPIEIHNIKVTTYVADFVYYQDGDRVVEDVKGMKKGAAYQHYSLKRDMLKVLYGITILET